MPRVLIVDDILDNQQILQEILEDLGATFDSAGSIVEAVEKATHQVFDLILMDLAIPRNKYEEPIVFGGLEASQSIRTTLGTDAPPIVVVTANGMRDIRDNVMAYGIAEIVEKASNFEERITTAIQKYTKLELPIKPSLPQPVLEPSHSDSKHVEPPISPVESYRAVPTQDEVEPETVNSHLDESFKGISALSDETTDLRKLVYNHAASALDIAEHLLTELSSQSHSTTEQKHADKLAEALREVKDRLADFDVGPRPKETLGHWLTNLLLKPDYLARKLGDYDREVLSSHWGTMIQIVQQELRRGIALSKSELAQRTIPVQADPDVAVGQSHVPNVVDAVVPEFITPQATVAKAVVAKEVVSNAVATEKVVSEAVVPEPVVVEPTDRSSMPPTKKNVIQVEPQMSKPVVTSDEMVESQTAIAQTPPAKRRVLIVDDEAHARQDLEDKLKRLNYQVISCDNPETAIQFLDCLRIDVCLLDLDMPEISGLEMIDHIRASRSSGNASIIVVSGSSEKFAAADAIENGADDYLEKPADQRLLQARIQSCLRQTDTRRTELGRFLPNDVLDQVINNQDMLEQPMPADISVIVCDIREFSRVSERIGPVQTIRWISDVMNELSQIVLSGGGTIIHYGGDEIMAMWGAPIASQNHANDACDCAIQIQKATEMLSRKWFPVINSQLRIGIGINSGLAVVGNTGSKHLIKYGPLGDVVNVAARVQGATKYLHSPVLLTQATASRIDAHLRGRRVCTVRVQNINEPVLLYELNLSGDNKQLSESARLYEDALKAFELEDLPEALKLLANLLYSHPNDGPAKLLMMRVINTQMGGAFDPIWTFPGK